MFGRKNKRLSALEQQVKDLCTALKETVEACKIYDKKLRALADREARHEMDVKERLDEYAMVILANESKIKVFEENGGGRTIVDLVNEHGDGEKVGTARIIDEWLNGKSDRIAEESSNG